VDPPVSLPIGDFSSPKRLGDGGLHCFLEQGACCVPPFFLKKTIHKSIAWLADQAWHS
jgi:hypothetical protein